MKNDSLKKGLHPQPEVITLKKNRLEPKVEVISILSGFAVGYEGRYPPTSFTRADVS